MSEKIEEQALLDEILRIKNLVNKIPQQKDIIQYSVYGLSSYKRCFGTFNNAIIKLGFIPEVIKGCNKEDVKEEIVKLKKSLGRNPTSAEFSALAKISYITARKIFDNKTWKEILVEVNA